ncbi:putative 4-mercaptohistidine N1-methyltransferase [Pelagicoccus albus]|uniref:Putative 4-mercaptohistidine N1-methyltransferase n=1 Tax=Pelagicoccus albus TaxID=415222 RepID=A0A7X1B4A5_9BACT|nr:putative 4-mercaptohistidine N1-methyltransferase [Pelagicoccus albus]MBC2605282.1 putative 4-mercaptohistidine N1-methyltransferase [Pelagicoccus albus]
MTRTDSYYETDKIISEYLLFHYGEAEHFRGPPESLSFPQRCGQLALRHPVSKGRALDLGCAVGGSSCELSAHFEETIGIDFSHGLIEAAKRMQEGESADVEIALEGDLTTSISLHRPNAARPTHLRYQQGDAMNLSNDLGTFDFVLMANLIDRLPDPARCLHSIASLINSDGILAITSPYTWLEEFTPRDKWLGGFQKEGSPVRSYQSLQKILQPEFEEIEALDMPFLIREHSRKNQYSIAQATLWRRR